MKAAAAKEYEHIGESRGCADHLHDLIHELSRRLDAVWRLDQYAANAEGHAFLQECWRGIKYQEETNIKELKNLLAEELKKEEH